MVEAVINYIAVVAAAVVSMILGWLWYSPVLFGNLWMKLSGINPKKVGKSKQKGMGKLYFIAFIGLLVTAYVLAHFVDYLEATTISAGMQAGFWIWIGFVAPVMLGTVLWDEKPWRLYFILAGYQLVSLLISGSILAVWT